MTRSKRCARCRVEKVLDCFYVRNREKGWLYSACKVCHRAMARESWRRRWQVRKEVMRANRNAYRKRHWPTVLAKNNEYRRRVRAAAKEEKAWYLRRSA